MIALRVSDKSKVFIDSHQEVSLSDLKRYNNTVRYFKVDEDNETIDFYNKELQTKMIPKDSYKDCESLPVYFLCAGEYKIYFQCLSPVNFLCYDDDNNNFYIININELCGDESIVIYDHDTDDYEYINITDFGCVTYEDIKALNGEIDFDLSRYIIYIDKNKESLYGLILNNFLIV